MKRISKILLLAMIGIMLLPTVAGAQQIGVGVNPVIDDISDVVGILERIFNWMFAIFLIIAAIFIMLAAFNYLTAGGDEEKLSTAKKQFIYAIVAIVIAFLATSVQFVVDNFLNSPTNPNLP